MDVVVWLRRLGLERYEAAFRDNDIDAEVLPNLTADDLISIGVTSVSRIFQAQAAPTSADGELEDVRLSVHGAPRSLGAEWLPAVEQFGEGLFIHRQETSRRRCTTTRSPIDRSTGSEPGSHAVRGSVSAKSKDPGWFSPMVASYQRWR